MKEKSARTSGLLIRASFVFTLAALMAGIAVAYVHREKVFYAWDGSAYHRSAWESLDQSHSVIDWCKYLRLTMQTGFSQLFTVPIVPWMNLFGDGRAAFISGITFFYITGFAIVCAALTYSHKAGSQAERIGYWLSVICCASLPVCWRASLAGYPDVGGVAISMIAVWVYFRDFPYERWSTSISLGLLFSLTFLFRRHLVYAVIAEMLTASIFVAFFHFRRNGRNQIIKLLMNYVRMGVTTGIVLVAVALLAPDYLHELLTTNFKELYKPFQFTFAEAVGQHVGLIGGFYLLFGLGGLVFGLFDANARPKAAYLLAYFVFSFVTWVGYLKYLSIQYTLHFAFPIACGIGTLAALLWKRRKSSLNIAALGLTTCMVVLLLDRLGFIEAAPQVLERRLPGKFAPFNDPNYPVLRELITYLRDHVGKDDIVSVDASSIIINSDMLTIGEGALYGRQNRILHILNGSHADTVQPYPLHDMLIADWVVHVSPLQTHLHLQDQGVVQSEFEAFQQEWPISRDFALDRKTFHLSNPGVDIKIFKRAKPTDPATARATAARVFSVVGSGDAWTGVFMVGRATSWAEYYDVHFLVPKAHDKATFDFRQVRLAHDQKSVDVYIEAKRGAAGVIKGTLSSDAPGDVTLVLREDVHAGLSGQQFSATQTVHPGGPFTFELPSSDDDEPVAEMEIACATTPVFGTAWGVMLNDVEYISK